MKKLLSVLLAVCLVLSMVTMAAVSVGAATADDASTGATTLTLKPNNDWLSDGARFAAYFWKSDGSSTWVNMTAGSNGTYTVAAPDGYADFLFGRMNPSGSNSFDSNDLWNQTSDLKVADGSGKIYEITGWDNSGQWINGDSGNNGNNQNTGSTVLTLKPNNDWLSDNARFAAYFWKDDNTTTTWANMTAGANGTYTVTAPEGYANVLFGRMDPSSTTNSFDSGVLWNQTGDLKVADGVGKIYEITGWDNSGQWINGTTPAPTGDYYLVGTMNNWTPSAAYKLAAQNDGTYKITKTLANGDGIKVAASADGTTVTAWYPDGMDNEYVITQDGDATVVFNPTSGSFTVSYGSTPVPTPGTTLKLKPNTDWASDGARFAAYFWKEDGTSTWANMTAAGNGIYTVTSPEGYSNVLFARMNPSSTNNSFDGNDLWNQTGDLLVADGAGKIYEITGWDNSGQWIPDGEATTDYYLVGTMNNWAPSPAYKMTALANGTYSITKALTQGTGIKVVASTDGNTATAWYPDGYDNEYTVLADDTVTVVFTPATGSFTVSYENQNPTVTLKLKPNADWKTEGARFAAYFWNDSNNYAWKNMTEAGDVYTVEAPEGYANVLFARMNPASTTNSFDNGVIWNQTSDLLVSDGVGKVYEITGWDNSGQWIGDTPAGDFYLVGTMTNWAIDPAYKMTAWVDGTYKITKVLTGGTGIKVVSSTDGTTATNWYPAGFDNETVLTGDDEVTVTFNPATGTFTVAYKHGTPATTLKLKPNTDWASDSARFAAYFWKDDNTTTQWVNMTAGSDGMYTVEAPEGYANVLFARMNPAAATNSFDADVLWNQTEDLKVADGVGKYYQITGWETGEWVGDGPTPETDYYVVGTMNNWTPAAAYKMTAGANNTYTFTTTLAVGDGLKVAASTDGTTVSAWYPDGMDNEYQATQAGEATITFNATTGNFTVVFGTPEPSNYYLVGDMNNWTPAAAYKLTAGANGTYTLTTPVEVNQKMKVAKSTNGTTIDENGYYPGGVDNDYVATQTANATITFYPNGNSGSTDNGGFFTVTYGTAPTSNYYVVGDMNNWTPDAAYKLTAGANGTYTATFNVTTGDKMKVAKSTNGTTIDENGYYPGGVDNDYVATQSGEATLTFYPSGNSGSSENGGFFTVAYGDGPDGAGYYIVKDQNRWTIQAAMKLTRNTAANGEEYMLTNVPFIENEGFKIAYSADGVTIANNGYFPNGTGNDDHAPAAGDYTVYFRPNADGVAADGWYANMILLVAGHTGQTLGDIDGDGQITIQDVTMLQRALAEFITLTDDQRAAADVNKDGRVNVKDVTEMQRFLANLRPAFA